VRLHHPRRFHLHRFEHGHCILVFCCWLTSLGEINKNTPESKVFLSTSHNDTMRSRFFSSVAFALHSSFLEIANRYDGFILDQYGVLHNGVSPLPGAIDTLEKLHALNKKLIILSNTSSPAKSAIAKLAKLGFDPKWFQGGAVTSGEESSRYIERTYGSSEKPLKAIWFTYAGSISTPPPLDFIEKCGNIEMATSIEEADLVIAHGGEIWYHGPEQNQPLGSFMRDGSVDVVGPILAACCKRKLPFVCANPDFVVRQSGGSFSYMPGTLAQLYEHLGGEVKYFGKPHPEHFRACLDKLNLNNVAHVGDSLHHDIAGANAAGIDSVFVTSGIHCDELKSRFGAMPSDTELKALFQKEASTPTHVISTFSS